MKYLRTRDNKKTKKKHPKTTTYIKTPFSGCSIPNGINGQDHPTFEWTFHKILNAIGDICDRTCYHEVLFYVADSCDLFLASVCVLVAYLRDRCDKNKHDIF